MGVDYTEVIERMKQAAKLGNDSRLARALGVTPQAFSNYRKLGKVSSDMIVKFSEMYGVSVDWLLYGDSEFYGSFFGGLGTPLSAMEGTETYGISRLSLSVGMNREESIYTRRLIKIIRECDESTVAVVRLSIDAFLEAMEQTPQAPVLLEQKEENPTDDMSGEAVDESHDDMSHEVLTDTPDESS